MKESREGVNIYLHFLKRVEGLRQVREDKQNFTRDLTWGDISRPRLATVLSNLNQAGVPTEKEDGSDVEKRQVE